MMRIAITSLLVLASLAAPCLLHRSTQRAWSERNQTLQRQARQLAALSAEHQRLSNLVAQTAPPLPTDQFTELLRLRGEIGRLRQAAKETRQLRAANQEALASPGSSRAPAPPDPAKIVAYWPKNQLAYAGYADPQSALKTFLWAASRGDQDSVLASMNLPEDERAELVEQAKNEHSNANARFLADSLAPSAAFYVVGQKMPSPDRAILDLYFDGEGKTRKVALQKTGQEWKFKTMGRAGQELDDLDNGR
jgi:hypothetical protein